jgi:NAD(P)-dependent dehydrogenase (short-subunit alcohol dehydrogenase family)
VRLASAGSSGSAAASSQVLFAIGVESGKTIDDPRIDTAALDRMHATNYTGVIAIIRATARVMRDNGRIIDIGSGIGSRAGRLRRLRRDQGRADRLHEGRGP